MSPNEETLLLFENYLAGALSVEETAAFDDQLKEDTEFASNFETYKEIGDLLGQEFSEERKKFKSGLQKTSDDFFSSESVKKEPKVIKFNPWKYSIAASIALLVGVFLFQQFGSTSVDDYLFDESISLTLRDGKEAVLKQAENSFNSQSYTEAITYFDTLLKEDASNTEIQFYKAISLDALARYNEADSIYLDISEGNSVYKYEATYYAAISQWKRENREAAQELLATIPKNATAYKKAQELLKKL